MSKPTKAELETEIKQLKRKINRLEEKLSTEMIRQGGEFEYLYTAIDMTVKYAQDLTDRTKLLRITTLHHDDVITEAHVREFEDKNRVFLMHKTIQYIDKDGQTKQQHDIYAIFFKRVRKE